MARMTSPRAAFLFVLCVLVAPSCQTGGSRISRLYQDLAAEVAGKDPIELPEREAEQRHQERADEVRTIVQTDGVATAEECFQASVLLVGTKRPADLELAETLARRAADLGEPRGLRVAAEAVDKLALLAGKPQKYGTQYVFEYVLDSWRLYPVDLTTTDEDRAAMGVPTYAELLASEDAMNRAHGKALRPR